VKNGPEEIRKEGFGRNGNMWEKVKILT